MHSHQSWEATNLWRLIQDRSQSGDPAPQLLKNVMPDIETVLSKGGTAPIDFTLHDEDHAFRVAQRMFELLPNDVAEKLGSFELSLLLLSAYLHDIGMTPTRDVVKRHHRYILTKAEGLLYESESRDLQRWLDEAHGGLELPVEGGATTLAGLDKAEELVAYYCRHQHNGWSEAWIREHLTDANAALYPGWIDDLVKLCRSHHEGLEALRHARFNARYHGSPAQAVNLRFLAALLRVADVLEFDPERTPDVIVSHREIAPKSRVYWHKDRFSFVINRDKREFRLDATTSDAKVHRAVLETVQQVDQELLTCNALQSSGAFRIGSFEDERCYWPWPAKVNAAVTEQEGRFVYIDGAFRPEPQHILKLLGGVELYKDPMVAVRELLQNAVDAVKEQIAWERLRRDNPSDPVWERKLGEMHKVALSLVEDADGVWLVCDDDGVGMTRAIIERHLLVSGAPPLPQVHQLEREAGAHGFSIERSGRFGIGVLSYFMIADRMVVSTCRSTLAGGDPDGSCWSFSTDGLGGFGELTPLSNEFTGTQIRLRIRHDFIEELRGRLVDCVKATVAYAPCCIELCSSAQSLMLGPGWCRTLSDFEALLLEEFRTRDISGPPDDALLPVSESERRESEDKRWTQLREITLNIIRWIGPVEGELPNNLGRFRMHLRYFDLPHGACLAFLDTDESHCRSMPSGDIALCPGLRPWYSWRGFDLSGGIDKSAWYGLIHERPFILEIDWRRGEISIDRRQLEHQFRVQEYINVATSDAEVELTKRFYDEIEDRSYLTLNSQIATKGVDHRCQHYFWWRDSDYGQWEEVDFPCAAFLDGPLGGQEPRWVRWEGRTLPVLQPISVHGHAYDLRPLYGTDDPDRLVLYGIEPVLLWEAMPRVIRARQWLCTAFPPDWEQVVSLRHAPYVILNSNHPLVEVRLREAAKQCSNSPMSFEELEGRVLHGERDGIVSWIFENMWKNGIFWNGIRDNRPRVYDLIFEHIQNICGATALVWIDQYDLTMLSGKGMSVARHALLIGDKIKVDDICLEWPSRSEWRLRRVAREIRRGGREQPSGRNPLGH